MRHAYIRAIGGLLWLAAAIASGITGSFTTAILYLALSAVFLRSAYGIWKKENGGRRNE